MSRYSNWLAALSDENREAALAWVAARPSEIRALCQRFPPGTTAIIKGRLAYLIGYAETDGEPGFYFTHIDPEKDFERATAEKFFLCGHHLEKVE